jgi:hypothetical protein
VLQSFNLKNPNEPAILFDLGRIKISVKDNHAGFAYLRKSKSNLNDVFTKQIFIEQLSNPDFDRVRDTPEFKKLVK